MRVFLSLVSMWEVWRDVMERRQALTEIYERTYRGVYAKPIRVACTTRPRWYSSGWTRETFVYRNDYDTVHIVPRHVSFVYRNNYDTVHIVPRHVSFVYRNNYDTVHIVLRHVSFVYRNDYDTVNIVPRHVSLSVASNVPRHKRLQSLLTYGDSDTS